VPSIAPTSFLTHPDAHPVALVLFLTTKYGPEWAKWEPETLWTTLAKDFVEPSMHTRAKLQAARTVLRTNSPFNRWEVFAWVSQAFNNNFPDFVTVHPASVPQLFNVVWICNELRNQPEYDDEVQRWIAACALNEGVVFLPPPLDFAQKQTSLIEYRCKRCGNIDPDDDTPECDYCGAPPSELEKRSRYADPDSVSRMWEMVKDKPSDSVVLQEDFTGVQLARLLVARDYLDMRKKQAENQAKELGLWK
jgi:ribosomal protein L37E